ncbi:MAG: aromatic ring-hydroxylating oxygenase subunit alpha [Alphaproteobacteria bacterium]
MRHETGIALIERIHENLATKRRELAERELRVPVAPYREAQDHVREQALFRRFPLVIGHGSELPEPGATLTHDSAGVPILAVRGADGCVRAFLNVCRHRGGRIVNERRGRAARGLICPYHAWSYGLDGRLSATNDAEAFPSVSSSSLSGGGLVALPAAERFGLIWVQPEARADGSAELDIDRHLGTLAEDFRAFGLEDSVFHEPHLLRQDMNWKLMADTFLEDHHFRFVHGRSVYRYYLDDAAIYDRFGPHIRYVIPKRTILDLKGTDQIGWKLRDHANILYLLFPNTVMVFVADHAAIFAMFPDGPERAVMELTFCVPEAPRTEAAKSYWDKNTALIKAALVEDFRVAEGVQSNIASGANLEFVFGRYEKGLQFFHHAIDEALGRR